MKCGNTECEKEAEYMIIEKNETESTFYVCLSDCEELSYHLTTNNREHRIKHIKSFWSRLFN